MEGLIQRALAVTDFCFSDRFLSHLVHHPHFLFTTCSAPTTIDFLLKLPDLYELYLLQSITDGWGERYERLETLGSRLEKDPWVRLAQRDPRLRNALWTHLSQHAVQWADWRLVRCVQSLVGRVAMSSLQTPDQQRSLDWCVRLQTQVWDIFGAFRTLLERTCEPWTEKRNAQLEQIHSLLYPALDHRQDLSFLDFKAWFQTSHQNWKLENVLKERFNANGMVIACFVTAFLMSESIQTDQLERWVTHTHIFSCLTFC
ncbi:hypothetical protein BY458DRAFT_321126 [Sporodiniella umbellata]|nr:hypothetical protein BY458DRAFT_321126 [Sporodiniella umbellata]